MLSFQRLDVYQRAIEFLALVYDIVDKLPKGHSDRADQLVRAAESVVRNIAEGAGRWSEADSSKHYKIARGEAMECAACLDVFNARALRSRACSCISLYSPKLVQFDSSSVSSWRHRNTTMASACCKAWSPC